MDPEYRTKYTEIVNNNNLTKVQKRVSVGQLIRKTAWKFKDKGMSNAEISELLNISESNVRTIIETGRPKGQS